MKNLKIEISLRDLILYVLLIALFIFCFLKFQVIQLEVGLALRHSQIEQNNRNVQLLNQNIQDHDKRIKRLEQQTKE